MRTGRNVAGGTYISRLLPSGTRSGGILRDAPVGTGNPSMDDVPDRIFPAGLNRPDVSAGCAFAYPVFCTSGIAQYQIRGFHIAEPISHTKSMTIPASGFRLTGWIEQDGRRLTEEEVRAVLGADPLAAAWFGGEFSCEWNGCRARDMFGILPGDCPKGTIMCGKENLGNVHPDPPPLGLEEALLAAIRLRSDEGVVALSGGVDSSLVAKIAGRECVAVGLDGSHDLMRAGHAAKLLGLRCEYVIISRDEVETALRKVVTAIPVKDPVNASIAATQYFITRWAGEHGYRRVITGQGADELFGGYARYLETDDIALEMEKDFAGLELQATRDQAVAAMNGVYLSLPYLDVRVVRAVRAVPHRERLQDGVRKYLLRSIAERHIPQEIAWYDKKAMQYGSGVMKVIRDLARKNGYSRSLQGYIDHIGRGYHG